MKTVGGKNGLGENISRTPSRSIPRETLIGEAYLSIDTYSRHIHHYIYLLKGDRGALDA